jgi:hypothetical protein
MNIPKPQYLITEIQDYFAKNNDLNTIEKDIVNLLVQSLDESEKNIFSEDFSMYYDEIDTIVDFDLDKKLFFETYKIKNLNVSIEFVENILDSQKNYKEIKNIIQFLDRKHPLFIKLMEMLNINIDKYEEGKLILYYRKDYLSSNWNIPVQTILVFEDGEKMNIDIFPRLAFELNNSLQSMSHKDSLGEFVNGLFDLFLLSSKILGNNKMEYIYIPPRKNKKNKKRSYYYKIAHIFLKKPNITMSSNQGKIVSLKLRKKEFSDCMKKIKSNLFLKK